MADFDVRAEGFKELSEKLYSLQSGAVADGIQRAALRSAAAVIQPALMAATRVRKTKVYGKQLPAGALKAAIKSSISLPKNGEPASATVHFGKLTYIAHIVDIGHVNPTASRKGALDHTPAYPFIRAVEAETRGPAADAYLATMKAKIDEVMK